MTDDDHTQMREAIADNLRAVRARIDAACREAGRDPAEVTLLPVSKTVDAARLRAAHAAGCHALGENKVQEAEAKADALVDLDIRWSIIGHLQTNKAKLLVRFAHEFQALDSLKVAEALQRRLQAAGRRLDVLVQVNSSGEPSKFGLTPDAVPDFVRQLADFDALRVRGLMTLAANSPDTQRVRQCFVTVRTLAEQLRNDAPASMGFDTLSMGMSGDFELAIAEGATVVRIGQAIFGARQSRAETPAPD